MSRGKIKKYVALPEATPSPFAISSFRYAPLRPANALRAAQHIFSITIFYSKKNSKSKQTSISTFFQLVICNYNTCFPLSTIVIPFKWSISCWMHRAKRPLASIFCTSFFKFVNSTTISFGRSTL